MLDDILVSDWMTVAPFTVEHNTSIMDTYKMMKVHNIRRLPVMKNDRLIGIVTLGDIREARPSNASALSVWETNYLLTKLLVREVMTYSPITVSPSDSVQSAAQLMLEKKIGGLPVVNDEGHLVGILTESDIFRMVVSRDVEIHQH